MIWFACLLAHDASTSAYTYNTVNRVRKFIGAAAVCTSFACFGNVCVDPVLAQMLTFPIPAPLKNNVVLLRAGQSFMDEKGIVETASGEY